MVRPLGRELPLRDRRRRCPALVAAGVEPTDPAIRRGGRILGCAPEPRRRLGRGHPLLRRPDACAARGVSTASQTAWALLALVAAGEAESEAARRGVAFLVDTQRADGNWDEPYFTGTGFPG